jgi:hypothetical protein
MWEGPKGKRGWGRGWQDDATTWEEKPPHRAIETSETTFEKEKERRRSLKKAGNNSGFVEMGLSKKTLSVLLSPGDLSGGVFPFIRTFPVGFDSRGRAEAITIGSGA